MQRGLIILLLALAIPVQAAQEVFNIGTGPNTGTGDSLRTVGIKLNTNFDQVFGYLGRPEAYGAVANDGLDDYDAIVQCLTNHNHVRLGPGRYDIRQRLTLGSNQMLVGSGMHATTLRLMDNCSEYTGLAEGIKYQVVRTSNVNASNIFVAHLTVDGNWDGQSASGLTNTIHSVALNGYHHVIDSVRALGWGYGRYSEYRECFPLLLDDHASTPITGNRLTIRNSVVTTTSTNVTQIGDVSCIAVNAQYGLAEAYNNYVHDIGAMHAGNLMALTGYGRDVDVRDNVVSRFYGVGVWGDSWTNSNVRVVNNTLDQVRVGVWLRGGVWQDMTISGNRIRNYQSVPAEWTLPNSATVEASLSWHWGILMSGSTKATNVVVADNQIAMNEWQWGSTNKNPIYAVAFKLTSSDYGPISLINNLVDTRVVGNDEYLRRIIFYLDDSTLYADRFAVVGNRTTRGRPMWLFDTVWVGGSNTTYKEQSMEMRDVTGPVALPGSNTTMLYSSNRVVHAVTDTGAAGISVGNVTLNGTTRSVWPRVFANGTAMTDPNFINNFNGAWSISGTNVTFAPRTPTILTDASTIATDASTGSHFKVTIYGNRTLANPSNPTDGQRITWEIVQDGTGSRTLTLGDRFRLGTTIPSVTLSTAANAKDILTAFYNASANFWYVIDVKYGY